MPGPTAKFILLRAGIDIATGAIVVINWLVGFMDLSPARVVAGIGLIGVGVVTAIGIARSWHQSRASVNEPTMSGLLIGWGVVMLYGAATDRSCARLIGWVALILAVALVGLAVLRRQRAQPAPATTGTS